MRKEWTPELLSCLLPTGPRHLLPLQTFVNDVRIPDQKYVTLKLHDVIRFGYDILSGPCPLFLAQVALGCPGPGCPGGGRGPSGHSCSVLTAHGH